MPARGIHEAEPHVCGKRQQKEAQEGSEQISAQLSKFKADSSARNTFFEQKSTFSSNLAINLSCDENRIFCYIWTQ